jgi:hypothetical protein
MRIQQLSPLEAEEQWNQIHLEGKHRAGKQQQKPQIALPEWHARQG